MMSEVLVHLRNSKVIQRYAMLKLQIPEQKILNARRLARQTGPALHSKFWLYLARIQENSRSTVPSVRVQLPAERRIQPVLLSGGGRCPRAKIHAG